MMFGGQNVIYFSFLTTGTWDQKLPPNLTNLRNNFKTNTIQSKLSSPVDQKGLTHFSSKNVKKTEELSIN
jgi:hypothetical protein